MPRDSYYASRHHVAEAVKLGAQYVAIVPDACDADWYWRLVGDDPALVAAEARQMLAMQQVKRRRIDKRRQKGQ